MPTIETTLAKLNKACASNSGHPGYLRLNRERCDVLEEIAFTRPLTFYEMLCLDVPYDEAKVQGEREAT